MALAELAAGYADQVRIGNAQRQLGGGQQGDRWGGRMAQLLRDDPRREPTPNFLAIASSLEPADKLVDVGGGAGRYGLPLALRCKGVINVEPSAGMREQFEATAREAGIKNMRVVPMDWLAADGVEGDVALVTHVTYFIEDIVSFIEKLNRTIRRRVIIDVHSVPPPNRMTPHYQLIRGSEWVPVPGHRELLPILWEMGILPEVRVVTPDLPNFVQPTRDAAIQRVLDSTWVRPDETERAKALLEAHFDELFTPVPGGFNVCYGLGAQELLITWETVTLT